MESGEHKVVTAIGHWDENNAIFRCAVVCPDCRYRPCKGRICGGSYMTTRSIFATGASTVALASSSLQDRPAAKRSTPSNQPLATAESLRYMSLTHMSFARQKGSEGREERGGWGAGGGAVPGPDKRGTGMLAPWGDPR